MFHIKFKENVHLYKQNNKPPLLDLKPKVNYM